MNMNVNDYRYREFPVANFTHIVNRTVIRIEHPRDADEGLRITFDDGSVLDVGFSGCEGTMVLDIRQNDAPKE